MPELVLDAHVHCGLSIPYEEVAGQWKPAGIHGGVVFSPVEEIYDRYDPFFTDSEAYARSRNRVHRYLLAIADTNRVYPYFFVWNDFPQVPEGFSGIKWHRHADEPVYSYGSSQCRRMIEEICEKRLPVVLEEEFHNTIAFIQNIAERTTVIIPHMGALNGGYTRLRKAGVFESEKIWVDTALAHPREIEDFAVRYGTSRMMFGSDYPFGTPASEKRKLEAHFTGRELRAILGGNLLRLLGIETPVLTS